MITSPRATFERILPVPRPFGILFIVAIVIGFGAAAPQFTEQGKQVILDAQMKAAAQRSPDGQVSPQAVEQFQKMAPFIPLFAIVGSLIFLPIITMFLSALYWALFNVVLGGTASFKQVLSTCTHSQVIGALGVLVGLPFMLMKPTASMGGPFNLGALAPMLEESSRLAKFLGNVSVFSIWGVLVNAIGLAVLYKRKTTGIFIALMVVFLAFAYVGSIFR